MALNPKQKLFAKHYARLKNATKAATKAGYPSKSAHAVGHKLLKNAEIQELIKESHRRIAARAEIKAADVLAEIKKIAFVDIAKAFKEDGTLLNPADMPEAVRKSLASFEVMEEFAGSGQNRMKIGYTKKFKTNDKLKALEMLGRHLQLFTDIVKHQGDNSAPLVMLTMPANGSEAPISQSPVKLGQSMSNDKPETKSAGDGDTGESDSTLIGEDDGA